MFKNVAAKFTVFAFDSTTNLPKTGDAANITAYVSIDNAAVTVLGDTSATEMDATNAKGYYLFDAAQGETNGDKLMISAKSATANIVVVGAPAVIFTRPTTGWLAPTVATRTLDVSATGEAGVDWANVGSPTTANALTGTTIAATQKVDIETIKTQAVTCAAGVTVLASVGTAATSTAQTGDNFARLGAPAGASVSADIAAAKVDTAAIKVTTDKFVFTVANQVDSNVITKTGFALSATGSAALTEAYAADGAAMTLNQAIYMIWSLLAERNASGTTLTTLKLDGATTAMTFTLDAASPSTQTRAT